MALRRRDSLAHAPVRELILAGGAATIAACIALVAAANAATSPKTEHFSIVSISYTSPVASVIATGGFTAGGTIVFGPKASSPETLHLPGGTFKMRFKNHGAGQIERSPITCLHKQVQPGTYKLSGGTGAYRGILGSGKFTLTITGVAARVNGRCSITAVPAAYQFAITAIGPASRP